MSDTKLRIAAFASGGGSNLEAIMNKIDSGEIDAEIAVVLCNKSTAGALEKAQKRNIPALHISKKQFENETDYINHLLSVMDEYAVNFVVLAGYLQKVPEELVRKFHHKMLNIHPALLPAFGGKGLYGHFVHEAVLEYGCKISGATVHLVEADYDTGAPVVQKSVPAYHDDTPETLAARVLEIEHEIYPEAVKLFAENRVKIEGRKVIVLPESNRTGLNV